MIWVIIGSIITIILFVMIMIFFWRIIVTLWYFILYICETVASFIWKILFPIRWVIIKIKQKKNKRIAQEDNNNFSIKKPATEEEYRLQAIERTKPKEQRLSERFIQIEKEVTEATVETWNLLSKRKQNKFIKTYGAGKLLSLNFEQEMELKIDSMKIAFEREINLSIKTQEAIEKKLSQTRVVKNNIINENNIIDKDNDQHAIANIRSQILKLKLEKSELQLEVALLKEKESLNNK